MTRRSGLTLLCVVAGVGVGAQEARLDVRFVTDEAEAVLALLDERSGGDEPVAAAWERLFASEGYRRLKAREAAMGRAVADEEFRSFVLGDSLMERRHQLRATLAAWASADLRAAAQRAFEYLPKDAVIRAKIYPVIKPRPNSFVFQPATDPAIFLYLDPSMSPAQLENVVAHELHHIGYAGACPEPDADLPAGVRDALDWMSGFGEGRAVLAAAGGPAVHPHATSDEEERRVWDRDIRQAGRDMARMERFFLDLVDQRLTEEDARERGFAFVVSDDVPQGAFYTVGWHMAATIERELGRQRLVATLCDPLQFLLDYNRSVERAVATGAGEDEPVPPVWSDSLLQRLGG